MVFGGFSLILALSCLGRQAQALPSPQGDREQHSQHFQHKLATMASGSPMLGNNGPPTLSSTSMSSGISATASTIVTSSSSTSLMPSGTPRPTVTYFESRWNVPERFKASESENIFYEIPPTLTLSDGTTPLDPVLFVCQTSVQMANGALLNAMNSSNTWSVAQVPICQKDCPQLPLSLNELNVNSTSIDFLSDGTAGTGASDGFFFCIAHRPKTIDHFECGSYGPLFTITGLISKRHGLSPRQVQALSAPPQMPNTVLSITTFSSMISVSGVTITATPTASALTTSQSTATTSMPEVHVTTTVTPTSLPFTVSAGLSTGAKVGIALGALVLVALLLLAALFFLRRKHRSRSPPPEQVMLTRDMHTDSFARNARIIEKETASANTTANASPVEDSLPIQRHSAVQPYDSIPAAPYTGDAASVPRRKPTAPYTGDAASVPRRNPTNASAVSRISGPTSPRSLTVSTPPDEYEEYRDQPMPVYGDARHSPRVYSTEERQGVKAPFLSEEGMSAEEVARLVEEERRIDAAIAEAERSGRR